MLYMKNQIQVDPEGYTKRWVSYLDLLGFTDLVNTKSWLEIISFYETVIERLLKKYSFTSKIEITWFSDTFLLYSPDNTKCSFFDIDYATRFFIYSLIEYSIPVRGAMSCGDLYADRKTNTFFGRALIEAYDYGDNQDWIGFVLTPSAVERLAAIDYYLSKVNYSYWNIPYKKAAYCASAPKHTHILEKSLPAYIIGNATRSGDDNNNDCLDRLCKMKGKLKDSRLTGKYENTINFIKKKQLAFPTSC